MSKFAVIGAGTAGLATAIALSRQNNHVTVFERHPKLAPVGAGMLIQPSGIRALHALDAGQHFHDVSVPVTRLDGRSHRGWRLVDIDYAGEPARGVSRPAMTEVLLTRAKSRGPVEFWLGTPIENVVDDGWRVSVEWENRAEHFDGVVIASGSGSDLAVRCGLSAPATPYPWGALNAMFEVDAWEGFEHLQQRFLGPRKLMGLMPTGLRDGRKVLSFFWSLPVSQLAAWEQDDFEGWKNELLQLWPQSEPVVQQFANPDQFSFATYRHAWPKKLANGRVCLVGDAAHAMSPQLGLGSTLAMGDALCLAECLTDRNLETGFKAYEHARLAHVKRFQVLSRALTPCFQADLPAWWRDIGFAAGLYVPGVRWLMRKSLDA